MYNICVFFIQSPIGPARLFKEERGGGVIWDTLINKISKRMKLFVVLMLDFAKEEVQGAITFLYTGQLV